MMSAFKFSWVDQYLKRDPAVIVDAGCYNASDSIEFKERWPDARVIAFEACPDNYRQIERSGRALVAGVETHHLAVCDHENGVQFNSNTDTNQTGHFGQTGSILQFGPKLLETWKSISVKPPRLVPSVRLDLFCQRLEIARIDLLHMDVQGAEYFVLVGLGEMRPPIIYLEIDETAETDRYIGAVPESNIRGWFDAAGYKRVWDSPHDALYVHESC